MGVLNIDAGLQRRLVGYARRFVGDADEAEDVAQETWMRVARHDPAGARPEAWLFRVCRHAAIDHVRARRVRRAVWRQSAEPEALEAQVAADPPEHADWPADVPANEPGSAHGSGPPLLEGPATSEGLSPSQRLLLALHYGRTLPQPVLSRMSGLQPSALRVRLFRARRALVEAP